LKPSVVPVYELVNRSSQRMACDSPQYIAEPPN
jgi:hypothetical protein